MVGSNGTGKRAGKPGKSSGIANLLEGSRVCIVAGPGGVGKTTVSAALGLEMARRGQRVAVVTIDPAKRLASALGLERLDNTPHRVSQTKLAKAGVKLGKTGELWAMALEPKAAFDDLIGTLAPDAASRDRVLDNRIYGEISSAVAGAQEFMAVSKLYELESRGDFDLVVLDTPPSRNALDFLDAPDRLAKFFDGRAIQLIMRPAGVGLRFAGGGTGLVFAALKRLTGINLLGDLADFFTAISGLIDGILLRIRSVGELLEAEDTSFVIVSSGETAPLAEARFLAGRLEDDGHPLRALIINRIAAEPGTTRRKVRTKAAKDALGDSLSGRLAELIDDAAAAAARDAAGLELISAELKPELLVTVPQFGGDVHDIVGLARICEPLFADG